MAARSSDVGVARISSSGASAETRRLIQPRVSGPRSVDPSPFSRPASLHPASREEQIAHAAYYRAERRGFAPGGELEDWLAAEREIDDGA